MKNISELCETFNEVRRKLRAEIELGITEFLKERGIDYYEFSENDDAYGEYQFGEMAFVSYDGGNHPEYASDCYAEVYGVGMREDGELYVILDEEDEYSFDRIWSVEELISVYEAVAFFADYDESEPEE